MTPKELKALTIDRAKIKALLDRIGEFSVDGRAEVISLCENGGEVIHKDGTVEKLSAKSYRDFYLSMAAT